MLAARCHPQNTIPKTKAQCAKGGRMYPNAPPSIQWRSGRRAFGTVCRKWKHCKGCEQRVDIISGPRICSRTWSANSSYHRWHGPDQGQKIIFCLPFDNISRQNKVDNSWTVQNRFILTNIFFNQIFWQFEFFSDFCESTERNRQPSRLFHPECWATLTQSLFRGHRPRIPFRRPLTFRIKKGRD